MSERNGAKIYLQLTAYELGQLAAVIPTAGYRAMDDNLRRKIHQAKDQATKDATVEEGLRILEEEDATDGGDDPFDRPTLTDSSTPL